MARGSSLRTKGPTQRALAIARYPRCLAAINSRTAAINSRTAAINSSSTAIYSSIAATNPAEITHAGPHAFLGQTVLNTQSRWFLVFDFEACGGVCAGEWDVLRYGLSGTDMVCGARRKGMPGTDVAYSATSSSLCRSPDSRRYVDARRDFGMLLRPAYALSSTDVAYGPTRSRTRACYGGTLTERYAKSRPDFQTPAGLSEISPRISQRALNSAARPFADFAEC
eukprot:2721974-Rhodomonas_salina.3